MHGRDTGSSIASPGAASRYTPRVSASNSLSAEVTRGSARPVSRLQRSKRPVGAVRGEQVRGR
ncbi:hypothetical protein GCM10023238_39780 [Streptomyces heliomycini]